MTKKDYKLIGLEHKDPSLSAAELESFQKLLRQQQKLKDTKEADRESIVAGIKFHNQRLEMVRQQQLNRLPGFPSHTLDIQLSSFDLKQPGDSLNMNTLVHRTERPFDSIKLPRIANKRNLIEARARAEQSYS